MNIIIDKIQSSFSDFLIYILKGIATFIIESSDLACPIICLLALAFYVAGNRKAGKYVSGSFVFYFLAQALRRFVVK
jgi:hypothetical protein